MEITDNFVNNVNVINYSQVYNIIYQYNFPEQFKRCSRKISNDEIFNLVLLHDEGEEDCFICMKNKVQCKLPCSHQYCKNCLLEVYRQHHKSCAFCRREIGKL